jgi:RNA polymerase sigma factor (sigma-70 family)
MHEARVSTTIPDVNLLARAAGGDLDACNDLVKMYYPIVRRACLRTIRNHALADEAAQEAIPRLLRGLPSFDLSRSFERWLLTIAVNTSRDVMRRERKHACSGGPEDAEAIESQAPTVEQELILNEEARERGERVKECDLDGQSWAMCHLELEHHRAGVLARLCNASWADIRDACGYHSSDSAQKCIVKAVKRVLTTSPEAYADARAWVDRCRQRTGRQRAKFLDLVDLDTIPSPVRA